MKEKTEKAMLCPKCGQEYDRYPALSRKDSKTLICPDCGVLENLDTIGVEPEEQEKIIEAIKRSELPNLKLYEPQKR